jgi:digeranylgeranylglycerophospholipid reductase
VAPQDTAPKQIAVVGSSAAGLYTAMLLARRGVRVQVMERAATLEPIPRTLIVTRHLRQLLGPVAEPAIVNEINRFELFTDGRSATIQLAKPDLVIERSTLIRNLAEQAQLAGTQIKFGRKFVKLEGTASGVKVVTENSSAPSGEAGENHQEFSAVIGADGASSKVAESGGWPRQNTVPLVQAIVKLPKDYPAGTVRVWFVPDDTPYFYWLIPDSPTHAAIGLIGEDGAATRLALTNFLIKRDFEPISYQGARIPVYERWIPVERSVGNGKVYLVGDAAGQVKVTTVGGIVTGFRGAEGVAESILNGGSGKSLKKLRRELDLHLLIRRGLHHFQQEDYSGLVDLLNASARESLSNYTRDEAASVLWHVFRKQPRLLLIGLRGLLTGRASLSNGRR